MKERPILFIGPMVRAILSGRKTQTRRMLKGKFPGEPMIHERECDRVAFFGTSADDTNHTHCFGVVQSPYGKPGDRLWVRETHAIGCVRPRGYDEALIRYRADAAVRICGPAEDDMARPLSEEETILEQFHMARWRPSIHMPRWASRITLEVTGVRVERLQEISRAEALAEGVESSALWPNSFRDYLEDDAWCGNARVSYQTLWESINGPGSWAANPWVWVVEFQRVDGEGVAG